MTLLINPTKRENVLAFAVDGDITKKTMDSLLSEFKEKEEKYERVCLYGEIRNVGTPENLGTVLTAMKLDLKAIGNVDKYAIVTNKKIFNKAEGVADFLTPGMNIKVFGLDEKEKAVNWLETRRKHTLTVTKMDKNALGICINGKLRPADYDYLNEMIDRKLDTIDDKLCATVEILNLEGITFGAMWKDLMTGLKFYKNFEKIAILGKEDYLKTLTNVGNFLTPGMEMKYFPLAEKLKAELWLK